MKLPNAKFINHLPSNKRFKLVSFFVFVFVLNDGPKKTNDNNFCDENGREDMWQYAFQRQRCYHACKYTEQYGRTIPKSKLCIINVFSPFFLFNYIEGNCLKNSKMALKLLGPKVLHVLIKTCKQNTALISKSRTSWHTKILIPILCFSNS